VHRNRQRSPFIYVSGYTNTIANLVKTPGAGSLNFTCDEVLAQDIYNRPNEQSLSFKNTAKHAIGGLVDNLNGENASLFVDTGVKQLESLHSLIFNEQGSETPHGIGRDAAILRCPIYPASILQNVATL
jgi:hypothetical protein